MSTNEQMDAAIRWINGMSPNRDVEAQRLAAAFEERDRALARQISDWILSHVPPSGRHPPPLEGGHRQWYANEIKKRWDKPAAPIAHHSSRDDKIGPPPRKTDQQITEEAHAAVEKLMICRVCGARSSVLVPLCETHTPGVLHETRAPDSAPAAAPKVTNKLRAAFRSRFGESGSHLADAILDTVNDAVRGLRPAVPATPSEDTHIEWMPAQMEESSRAYRPLQLENGELRRILSMAVDAIGNGSCAAEWCSLDFLRDVPKEIAAQVAKLRRERDEAQARVVAQVAKWLRAGGPLPRATPRDANPSEHVARSIDTLRDAADSIERGEFRYRDATERASP